MTDQFNESPEEQNEIGFMHLTGDGTPKDDKEALFWFKRSAEQGISEAQFYLAVIYRKDKERARNNLSKY